ncbi:MAG: nucleotidyltransferase domain-containing protein [Candidatus Binatia bacterium]
MEERDKFIVERFKSLMLAHGVPLHSIVLFGSRARGDHDPDSDYDVLVVVEQLDGAIHKTVSHCA